MNEWMWEGARKQTMGLGFGEITQTHTQNTPPNIGSSSRHEALDIWKGVSRVDSLDVNDTLPLFLEGCTTIMIEPGGKRPPSVSTRCP